MNVSDSERSDKKTRSQPEVGVVWCNWDFMTHN